MEDFNIVIFTQPTLSLKKGIFLEHPSGQCPLDMSMSLPGMGGRGGGEADRSRGTFASSMSQGPKGQGPKGRGPNVLRTSGPWPQGPSDLRCQGLKVRGPKVRGPMGRGLFSLFFVVFGTVLIQAYIYRCHIIPPWLGKEHSNRVRHSNHSQAQRALGSRRPHSNRVSTSACDTRPELYSSQLTYSGVTLSPPG